MAPVAPTGDVTVKEVENNDLISLLLLNTHANAHNIKLEQYCCYYSRFYFFGEMVWNRML